MRAKEDKMKATKRTEGTIAEQMEAIGGGNAFRDAKCKLDYYVTDSGWLSTFQSIYTFSDGSALWVWPNGRMSLPAQA